MSVKKHEGYTNPNQEEIDAAFLEKFKASLPQIGPIETPKDLDQLFDEVTETVIFDTGASRNALRAALIEAGIVHPKRRSGKGKEGDRTKKDPRLYDLIYSFC